MFSDQFAEGYSNRQKPEEGKRAHQLKHCDDNNKDEGNSTNVDNVNNNVENTSLSL